MLSHLLFFFRLAIFGHRLSVEVHLIRIVVISCRMGRVWVFVGPSVRARQGIVLLIIVVVGVLVVPPTVVLLKVVIISCSVLSSGVGAGEDIPLVLNRIVILTAIVMIFMALVDKVFRFICLMLFSLESEFRCLFRIFFEKAIHVLRHVLPRRWSNPLQILHDCML